MRHDVKSPVSDDPTRHRNQMTESPRPNKTNAKRRMGYASATLAFVSLLSLGCLYALTNFFPSQATVTVKSASVSVSAVGGVAAFVLFFMMLDRAFRRMLTVLGSIGAVVLVSALAIPRLGSLAGMDVRPGDVVRSLHAVRHQIDLFRSRNSGTNPKLVGSGPSAFGQLIDPMYMRAAPVNPYSGSTTVVGSMAVGDGAVQSEAAQMDPLAPGQAGWLYNEATGDFAAIGFDERKWTSSNP